MSCAACGHDNGPDKDYGSRQVVCDGCGRTYDTERSAVALMLQRAAPAADPRREGLAAAAPQHHPSQIP